MVDRHYLWSVALWVGVKVTVKEYAQIPKHLLDIVVQPMLNVKRGYEVGKDNDPNDLGNRLLITSSAYYKHNHLWEILQHSVEEMANGNRKYFASVLDYTVGVAVGLFDEDHIEKEKKRLSSDDFDMEYGCQFINVAKDAFISPVDMNNCSHIKKIEVEGLKNFEYVMAVDVARAENGDNTAIHIFKILWRKAHPEAQLVYTQTLNGAKFEYQALMIRYLLKKFPNVSRIYMDTQNMGRLLADELEKEFYDMEEEKYYPPLIDMNDEQAMRNISNGIPMVYGIIPDQRNNHAMGLAVKKYTQKGWLSMYSLQAGDDKAHKDIQLTEEEERQVLEAEATRREILHIKAKPSGNFFKFEPVRRNRRKDRWSAMGLGLYGIDLLFEERQEDTDIVAVASISSRG